MPDTKYLRKNYQTYLFNIAVPADMVEHEGVKNISKSLETRDLREAQAKRDVLLGRYREKWQHIRQLTPRDPSDKEWLLDKLAAVRLSLKCEEIDSEEATYEAHELLDQYAAASGTPSEDIDDQTATEFRVAMELLSDVDIALLGETISSYLTDCKQRVQPQTHAQRARRYKDFEVFAGSKLRLSKIDRKLAGSYITEKVQPLDLSASTKKGIVRDLHALFEWAMERGGLIDANPFKGMAKTIKESSRGTRAGKPRPWKESELQLFFNNIDLEKHWKIFSGGALLLYTGARLEEVMRLSTDSIIENGLGVRLLEEVKNQGSIRDIPLHPVVQPLVELLAADNSGYLLHGYKERGANRKLGDGFGRQFRARQTKLKMPRRAAGGVAIHDLRHTFKTRADNCRMDARAADEIQGHASEGMRKVYSHGLTFEVKLEEISKLTYGDKIDGLFRNQISQLSALQDKKLLKSR
ncbi:MAG: DUF6538 domain-containing protein [bacterium]